MYANLILAGRPNYFEFISSTHHNRIDPLHSLTSLVSLVKGRTFTRYTIQQELMFSHTTGAGTAIQNLILAYKQAGLFTQAALLTRRLRMIFTEKGDKYTEFKDGLPSSNNPLTAGRQVVTSASLKKVLEKYMQNHITNASAAKREVKYIRDKLLTDDTSKAPSTLVGCQEWIRANLKQLIENNALQLDALLSGVSLSSPTVGVDATVLAAFDVLSLSKKDVVNTIKANTGLMGKEARLLIQMSKKMYLIDGKWQHILNAELILRLICGLTARVKAAMEQGVTSSANEIKMLDDELAKLGKLLSLLDRPDADPKDINCINMEMFDKIKPPPNETVKQRGTRFANYVVEEMDTRLEQQNKLKADITDAIADIRIVEFAVEMDEDSLRYLALWKSLAHVLHPIFYGGLYSNPNVAVDMSRKAHLKRAHEFGVLLELEGGSKSDYYHWLIAHMADDQMFLAKHFPKCTMMDFSCQRGEHQNKLFKKQLKHLYHMFKTNDNADLCKNAFDYMMRERWIRMLYFADTFPAMSNKQMEARDTRTSDYGPASTTQ